MFNDRNRGIWFVDAWSGQLLKRTSIIEKNSFEHRCAPPGISRADGVVRGGVLGRSRMTRFKQPTFVDLFCGIGGMRLAFENVGCRCVFSSDWDVHANRTYVENFGETPAGDIRKIASAMYPRSRHLDRRLPLSALLDFRRFKKNSLGRAHGFSDRTQGTLFFEVARIIGDKRPAAFVLENVKNLKGHDGGRTFRIIMRTLEEELGYSVDYKVLDGSAFVPQHRERIFIVGFREHRRFEWPALPTSRKTVANILDTSTDEKYTLSDRLWNYLQGYAKKHREAGNGFGFGLVKPDGIARTLSARYYKDGSEILIPGRRGRNPRRLTPRECARLMGFPDKFRICVSDTQAYRQFGNSVVVPLVEAVAKQVVDALRTPANTSRKQLSFILSA